jgi:N-acetylglutamate synthase-like GNAT family acetyltransferase
MDSRSSIRRARADDLGFLPTIERSSDELFSTIDGYPSGGSSRTVPLDVLERCREAGALWVAEEAAKPVGFLAGAVMGEDLFIAQLSVERAQQRRGLGSALLSCAIADSREQGISRFFLITNRSVPWNGPFYARHGFVELEPNQLTPALRQALEADQAHAPFPEERCLMTLTEGPMAMPSGMRQAETSR